MSTETTLPGTVVEDTAVGSSGWTNENNAKADDGAYATSNAFAAPPTTSYYLKATNYGASVSGTIDGHEIRNNCRYSGTACVDNVARLVKAGVPLGLDISPDSSNWPPFGSPADRTYGGPTELGGASWTDTDINSSTSGFAVSVVVSNFSQAYVDVLERTIYYTAGGGDPNTAAIQTSLMQPPIPPPIAAVPY